MMYQNNPIRRRFLTILFCTMLLAVPAVSGCSGTGSQGSDVTITANSETEILSSEDLRSNAASQTESSAEDSTPESSVSSQQAPSDGVTIRLSGTAADISGEGAAADGNTLRITSAGTYTISGTWQDGQIHIKAGKDDTVKLILDGLSLTNTKGAAIYAEQCGETILMLKDGTENTITDSGSTSDSSDQDSDTPNAAVFIQDDLTITGEGSLTVTGSHNGITGKDDVTVKSGVLTVSAAHHGITGKDQLTIDGGTLTVSTADGDGLRSAYSDTDKANKGHITINSGTIHVTAAQDGIQAAKNLTINGGVIDIITGGGSAGAPVKQEYGFPGGFGQTASSTDEESKKGLKAGIDLTINGGEITLDTYDDAVHSNHDAIISSGTLTIQSGDDGIHADNILTISGGTTLITRSYEGLEAIQVNIKDGSIDITASDDGINTAGGNDSSGFGHFDNGMDFGGQRPMPAGTSSSGQEIITTAAENLQQSESSSDTETALNISGGTVCVNAGGDGLDSNSALNISGGTIIVNGPASGGNGIIDHDGTCLITGGLLIGAGTSDMLEMPASTSTQKTVAITLSQTLSAGTLVYITDSSGSVIAAMQPEINYSCLILSTSLLNSAETYTVFTGGSVSGTSLHGYYSDASAVSGGTQFTTFTVSDAVTYVNESGVTTGNSNRGGFPGGRF